ncbi:MAG: hypothetical protein ABJF23_28405 [Bryobacteraceae bacterium]
MPTLTLRYKEAAALEERGCGYPNRGRAIHLYTVEIIQLTQSV